MQPGQGAASGRRRPGRVGKGRGRQLRSPEAWAPAGWLCPRHQVRFARRLRSSLSPCSGGRAVPTEPLSQEGDSSSVPRAGVSLAAAPGPLPPGSGRQPVPGGFPVVSHTPHGHKQSHGTAPAGGSDSGVTFVVKRVLLLFCPVWPLDARGGPAWSPGDPLPCSLPRMCRKTCTRPFRRACAGFSWPKGCSAPLFGLSRPVDRGQGQHPDPCAPVPEADALAVLSCELPWPVRLSRDCDVAARYP